MVLMCSGFGCHILISISNIPGGNPAVLKEPDAWASEFSTCEDCKKTLCDRCVRKRQGGPRWRKKAASCPWCSGRLETGGKERWERARTHPYPAAVTACQKAEKLAKSRRFSEALEAFDEAIRLRAGYPYAHFYRGIILRELGRAREAVAALDDALRADPAYAQAAFEKALVLYRAGESERAIAAYQEAIEIEPRYAAAWVNMAVGLLEAGRGQEALRACDEAIRLVETTEYAASGPNPLPYAYGAKGEALLQLGRPQEALDALEVALDSGLEGTDAYRNRADALEQLGRHEEARLARRLADDAARRD